MIGGNGDPYGDNNGSELSKELFIRWTQLTAFLPAMQVSNAQNFKMKRQTIICTAI